MGSADKGVPPLGVWGLFILFFYGPFFVCPKVSERPVWLRHGSRDHSTSPPSHSNYSTTTETPHEGPGTHSRCSKRGLHTRVQSTYQIEITPHPNTSLPLLHRYRLRLVARATSEMVSHQLTTKLQLIPLYR